MQRLANTSNTPVRRSLSPSLGSVSAGGLYMAPPTMTSIQVVTLTAASVADTSKTANATIVVNASSSTAPVNLFGPYGRSGIVTDGTKFSSGGLDGAGHADALSVTVRGETMLLVDGPIRLQF